MGKILFAVFVSFVFVLGVYLAYIIGGLIVAPILMFGWNYVMPHVFGLPALSYWQAFWLWIVSILIWKPVQTNNNESKR